MPTNLLTQPFDLRKYTNQYLKNFDISSANLPGAIPKPMTEAQQETLPYLQVEIQKEAKKRGLLQPIELIFDVLQSGQYLTANIAQRLIQNMQTSQPLLSGMPEAVAGALSGKVKGDWETVLFGGKTVGGEAFEGIVPWEPTTGAGKAGRKVAGFVANVVLDPLTYVGAGPATAARSAATKYSDDAVRAFLGRLGRNADDILPGLAQKGINWQEYAVKFARSPGEGLNYLKKYAGEDVTKLLSKVKKEAYNFALKHPAGEVTQTAFNNLFDDVLKKYGPAKTDDILRGAAAGKDDVTKQFQKLLDTKYGQPAQLPPPAQARQTEMFDTSQWAKGGIEPEVMFDPEAMASNLLPGDDKIVKLLTGLGQNPYAGAGTRAVRVFRKEFAVGERYPGWLQQLDKVKKQFGEKKIGGLFSDAWWALMNNPKSPVATLRRMFHVRNPYQKMVSIVERDVLSDSAYTMVEKGERVLRTVEGLTDEERRTVAGAMIHSQVFQEIAKKQGLKAEALRMGEGGMYRAATSEADEMARMAAGEFVQEPVTMTAADIINKFAPGDPDEASKLTKTVSDINDMTDEWLKFNQQAADRGLASSIGEWEDYLPIQPTSKTAWKKSGGALGPAQANYAKARSLGYTGHLRQETEKIKFLFGVDDAMAADIITNGGANLNVDLQDMLMRRAFAQNRFEQRINMVLQFREFGIDLNDIQKTNPDLFAAMTGKWGEVDVLGLKPIQNVKGLEGYVFDQEVADVLQRAVDIGSSDKSMRALVNAISKTTSWWRGWATLSPGFHMRNYFSNNITGFLKHGVEWFDPETQLQAFVATSIGLHGYDEGIKRLAKIFPKEDVLRIANKRIGDRTVAELARLGGSHGIVTRMSQGFQKPDTYDEFLKSEGKIFENLNINPLSTEFTPMQVSRNIGSYIESDARVASFLLDYKRAIKQGGGEEAAFDFAKTEAKKWFIDYRDLSKTEQNVLRNVIPFYSWLRGNISNQLSGLLQFTEMYSMIPKAQKAATMEGGPSREEMPEWMREMGMFPVGKGKDAVRFFWPNFPYQDLNKIPMKFRVTDQGIPLPVFEDPMDVLADIMADSHPAIKSLIQNVGNVDLFYKEPLGDVKPAPRMMRVITDSPAVTNFLDGLLRGLGFKEGLRADVDDKGRLVIDARIAKTLEDNILPLRMLPQYFDLPELLLPVIEEWKKKAFGAVDDYEALEEFFQTLSFYGGVKLKELESKEQEFWENEELLRRAEEARSKDKRKMPGASAQRQNWIETRRATHRRIGL